MALLASSPALRKPAKSALPGKRITYTCDNCYDRAEAAALLAHEQAFEGRTVSDVLAGVLRADPPWDRLPPNIHPRIRLLLERCLEKDPKNRYRDIADARVDIEKALADGGVGRPVLAGTDQAKSFSSRLWVMAVVLAALLAGAMAWYLEPEPPANPAAVGRFDYDLPEGQEFRNTGRETVAVSADGSRFVYNATAGLYLRSLDAFDARVIPGTEPSLTNPAFSPDGEWVAYFSPQDGKLKKNSVSGGTAVTLCDAGNPFGVSWSGDGTILFGQLQGIMRVSENGGVPELIVKTGPAEQTGEAIFGPQLLPGGEWVLFTLSTFKSGVTDWDRARIVAESLKTKERKTLWQGGAHGRYVPTGHLV